MTRTDGSTGRPPIPDRHSVTCAICGAQADERRTVALDPEQQYAASPEAFEMIGRVFVAREVFGSGEAHNECINEELVELIEVDANE